MDEGEPAMHPTWRAWASLVIVSFALGDAPQALACPFCSAVSLTLSEELKGSDVALLVKLKQAADAAIGAPADAEPPATPTPPATLPAAPLDPGAVAELPAPPEASQAVFEVVEVLKGSDVLGDRREIRVLYFGQAAAETVFLVFGTDPRDLAFSSPAPLSERSVAYVRKLTELPDEGPDRLAFFQDYFEDADPLLAGDAYDEFAKTPYPVVQALKERMHRDRLLGWIKDPNVSTNRRRLYLTMLGVCGQPDDVATLEELIRSDARESRTALDALAACYLNLKGPEGMPLLEDLFLKNPAAEYTDTYAVIMALRFHGQETTVIPRPRLQEGLRHILDRPQLADLVIPDLARWEDWSVMDRLVELFKSSNEETSWVRVPVFNYLKACPEPKAKEYLDELAKLDPESFKRASHFFPLGGSAPPPVPPVSPPEESSPVASATDPSADQPPPLPKDLSEAPTSTADTSRTASPEPGEPTLPETAATATATPVTMPPARTAEPSSPAISVDPPATPGRVWLIAACIAGGLLLLMGGLMRGKGSPEKV
jgi:hypothetical protein